MIQPSITKREGKLSLNPEAARLIGSSLDPRLDPSQYFFERRESWANRFNRMNPGILAVRGLLEKYNDAWIAAYGGWFTNVNDPDPVVSERARRTHFTIRANPDQIQWFAEAVTDHYDATAIDLGYDQDAAYQSFGGSGVQELIASRLAQADTPAAAAALVEQEQLGGQADILNAEKLVKSLTHVALQLA